MKTYELSTNQLDRYSRHILLPEIDIEGQEKLLNSSVALIGAGGLGAPAAMYLASSGIGSISIFDHDTIDLGNLQRQIAFRTKDIDLPKASQLKHSLTEINPDVKITAHNLKATPESFSDTSEDADIIIDASDNFDTRFILNEISIKTTTPLISGAAIGFSGQATTFNPANPKSPCYRCLYTEEEHTPPQNTCRDQGVFAPLTGIIGSIMAAESIKAILNIGSSLTGRLLLLNAKTMIPRTIKLPKDPSCPACGKSATR